MSITCRFPLAARNFRRGFTLVELLVVISIIAILAAVALPGITHALKVAKENGSMQTGRSLALSMFQYANDNDQTFPGALPNATPPVTVGTSTDVFNLLKASYISNTDALWIPGVSGTSKYNPTNGNLQASNVSWDVVVHTDDTGLGSNDPDQCPLILSTGSTFIPPATGTAGAAKATTIAASNPFGADGVAVAFKDCSAAFKAQTTAGVAFPISSTSLVLVNNVIKLTP